MGIWQQLRYDIEDSHTSAIVLISKDRIGEIELLAGMSNFILYPYDVRELAMRIKLILRQREIGDAGDVIRIGNLGLQLLWRHQDSGCAHRPVAHENRDGAIFLHQDGKRSGIHIR